MNVRLVTAALGLAALAGCGERPAATDAPSADTNQPAAMDTNPMREFGVTASNVFFYYADLEAAVRFYRQTLGLRLVADYGYAKIVQVAPRSFITLVDAAEGMHSADEPKTTAIALITDQLDEWWDYISARDVPLRSESYDPEPGRAHHGFVAIDPEGYYLEFERFNEHPENERLLPELARADTLYPEQGESDVPPGLGFKATVLWFYYRDMAGIQAFYEDVLGLEMIVDQGWTKIYPLGPGGFIGLVDESRGMHRYTDDKGVTLSLITADIDGWFDYLSLRDDVEMRHDAVQEDRRYRAFVAYDPEGYYLEWDVFTDAEENSALLEAVEGR